MSNQQAKAEIKETKETPIAYELAKRQKEISVAEFFTKNRHLLGFDNKRKALLMAVKEAYRGAYRMQRVCIWEDNKHNRLA